MDIQKNNTMRMLLYVCIGLLSVLTLLGAYSLYTLNYVIPEVSVEVPSDSDTNKDSHILTEEEIKAQLEELRPADHKELTEEEVKSQLEELRPTDYKELTEEEVKAQLEALKNRQ